jgi:ATP-dependent Lhr-like helicase
LRERFKEGDLRCMVATATLELGIDVGQVDLMIQISAPITIAGGLQRLGRAGHRLDTVSRGRVIPKTRGDLLKSLYVSREMLNGRIEATRLPREPLDVLAQHVVSMSCTASWSEEALLNLLRHAASYRELRLRDLRRVLSMLAGDDEHREDIPAKPRIAWDRVKGTLEGTPYSRMLAISAGGTIPDRGLFPVVLADGGTRLGELDEEYVFESRPGDVFMLGNAPWRMERIDRDRVVVSPAASTHGAETPFWRGDGLGMPLEQGLRYGQFVREMEARLLAGTLPQTLAEEGLLDDRGIANLLQYLSDQREATDVLPTDRQIVMETVAEGAAGVTVILHALFGGRVNATLETLLRHVMEDTLKLRVHTTHTDELILLYLYGVPDEVPPFFSLLSPDEMEQTLLRILPSSSRFSITFRYNAYRALMMGTRKHGARLPLWIQRLRSVEALEQAIRSTDHPLLVETMRECMEDAFDLRGTAQVLRDLQDGTITVHPVQSWYPSPFAAEVMLRFEGDLVYEPAAPHPGGISRPVGAGMDALHLEDPIALPVPDAETVRRVVADQDPLPRFLQAQTEQEVHALLLMYGDLAWDIPADAADAASQRLWSHLQSLLAQERVRRTATPCVRWFAREEEALYMAAAGDALPGGQASGLWTREEAIARVLRRHARFSGPFVEADVRARYGFDPDSTRQALVTLERDRFLVQARFGEDAETSRWCHRILWERMRRQDIRTQTAAVQSAPASEYAAWLPGHQQVLAQTIPAAQNETAKPDGPATVGASRPNTRATTGSGSERLLSVLSQFSGMPFPASWWEEVLLPARVPNYHPGLLDKLCATGRVAWRAHPDAGNKALRIAFYAAESLLSPSPAGMEPEEEANSPVQATSLTPEAEQVRSLLVDRGACFTHQLTSMSGLPVTVLLQALHLLVLRGLVANDVFAPVRLFLEWDSIRDPSRFAKRLAMMTARMEMGRWEAVVPVRAGTAEDQLQNWFRRWGIACREVSRMETSLSWMEAYDWLKNLEFAGKARRGLFYGGFDGIQFFQEGLTPSLLPGPVWHVLTACDPALAYGGVLPHDACALSFARVPGTVVVLRDGIPVLALDRTGTGLRATLSDGALDGALRHLVQAFREKRFWPSARHLRVRTDLSAPDLEMAPERLCQVLAQAGFEREPNRMVLRK